MCTSCKRDAVTRPGCAIAGAGRTRSILSAADLFVHPGTQETFGLVALESQACGTPLLGFAAVTWTNHSHDQSSWAEEVDAGIAGGTIEIARVMISVRLGKGAAATVRKEFSWPRFFNVYFTFIGSLL